MLTGLPKMCKTEAECLLVGAPFGDGPRFIYPRLYTPVVSDFDEDHRVYRLRALNSRAMNTHSSKTT